MSAAATAAVLGGLQVGLQVYQGEKDRKEVGQEARRQRRTQEQFLASAQSEIRGREERAEAVKKRSLARERQRLMGAQGRRSTILTGPLGLEAAGDTTKATILGG